MKQFLRNLSAYDLLKIECVAKIWTIRGGGVTLHILPHVNTKHLCYFQHILFSWIFAADLRYGDNELLDWSSAQSAGPCNSQITIRIGLDRFVNRENVKWLVEYYEKNGLRWDFDMIVIDELSSFKNYQSQRFKWLRKEDFLLSCQQIVEMLSDTAALDKKIEAQYIYLNGLAVSMQEFIKENAMKPQDEDFYQKKMAEYNSQKAEAEKALHDLQDKRAARLSRKELLEGLIRTMSREGIVTDTFDGKLWLLLVEKVTVGTDGKLTFTLRNGMEIEV